LATKNVVSVTDLTIRATISGARIAKIWGKYMRLTYVNWHKGCPERKKCRETNQKLTQESQIFSELSLQKIVASAAQPQIG
jgi:hypothetical protein